MPGSAPQGAAARREALAQRLSQRGAAHTATSKHVLTVTDVQSFLGKSKRAFYLLRMDPRECFPAPFVVSGRDHWLVSDILDWIESRRRSDSVPGRKLLSLREPQVGE